MALENPNTLKNVPKLLKAFIQTGAFITREDKYFWEKLKYEMPEYQDEPEFGMEDETPV